MWSDNFSYPISFNLAVADLAYQFGQNVDILCEDNYQDFWINPNTLDFPENGFLKVVILCVEAIDSVFINKQEFINLINLVDDDNDPSTPNINQAILNFYFAESSCDCELYSEEGYLINEGFYNILLS